MARFCGVYFLGVLVVVVVGDGVQKKALFFGFFLSLHGKNHSRKPQDPQKNKTQGSGVLKGANISLPREKKGKSGKEKVLIESGM